MDYRALRLLDLVRSALRRVEETTDLEKDGPAVQGLKSSVVLTIAERELRASEGELPNEMPVAAAEDLPKPAEPEIKPQPEPEEQAA